MQVHNRDVFPTEDTIKLYPFVRFLVVNPIIDEAFRLREDAANKAKKIYHSRGRLGALLIVLSAVYTVADALILGPFFADVLVGYVAAALAGVGICIQLYIIATRQKETWLLNRFAAERLRGLKFQAFALAQNAAEGDALAKEVDEFSRAAIVGVDDDLNAGLSRLEKFEPHEALQVFDTKAGPANHELTAQAQDAYHRLRIAYQKRFTESELDRLGKGKRLGDTSADILYLFGAAIVFGSLMTRLIPHASHELVAWLDFLAVATFIIAAAKSILENASLAEQSRTRYEQYARDVEKLEDDQTRGNDAFREIVRRMELLAMAELDDFCRSATKISYRL